MPLPSSDLLPSPELFPGDAVLPTGPPVRVPHFALPFRFQNGAAVVVEQDTTEEIVTCCDAILSCPQGHRVELPEFGLPDPTFTESGPDRRTIEAALTEWEPRAQVLLEVHPDALNELLFTVQARIGAPSQD